MIVVRGLFVTHLCAFWLGGTMCARVIVLHLAWPVVQITSPRGGTDPLSF